MNTVIKWCMAMIIVGTMAGFMFLGLSNVAYCNCHDDPVEEATTVRQLDVVWWGQTQDGVYLFEDTTGNQWEVVGIEHPTGTKFIIELDNMGTPNRYWDDEVVNIYQTIEPKAES